MMVVLSAVRMPIVVALLFFAAVISSSVFFHASTAVAGSEKIKIQTDSFVEDNPLVVPDDVDESGSRKSFVEEAKENEDKNEKYLGAKLKLVSSSSEKEEKTLFATNKKKRNSSEKEGERDEESDDIDDNGEISMQKGQPESPPQKISSSLLQSSRDDREAEDLIRSVARDEVRAMLPTLLLSLQDGEKQNEIHEVLLIHLRSAEETVKTLETHLPAPLPATLPESVKVAITKASSEGEAKFLEERGEASRKKENAHKGDSSYKKGGSSTNRKKAKATKFNRKDEKIIMHALLNNTTLKGLSKEESSAALLPCRSLSNASTAAANSQTSVTRSAPMKAAGVAEQSQRIVAHDEDHTLTAKVTDQAIKCHQKIEEAKEKITSALVAQEPEEEKEQGSSRGETTFGNILAKNEKNTSDEIPNEKALIVNIVDNLHTESRGQSELTTSTQERRKVFLIEKAPNLDERVLLGIHSRQNIFLRRKKDEEEESPTDYLRLNDNSETVAISGEMSFDYDVPANEHSTSLPGEHSSPSLRQSHFQRGANAVSLSASKEEYDSGQLFASTWAFVAGGSFVFLGLVVACCMFAKFDTRLGAKFGTPSEVRKMDNFKTLLMACLYIPVNLFVLGGFILDFYKTCYAVLAATFLLFLICLGQAWSWLSGDSNEAEPTLCLRSKDAFSDIRHKGIGRCFLLGTAQIILLCIYVWGVYESYDARQQRFNHWQEYLFYVLGMVIQFAYIITEKLTFLPHDFWEKALKASCLPNSLYEFERAECPVDLSEIKRELKIRFGLSTIVNSVGFFLILVILPFQLSTSEDPTDFVLNAVAVFHILELDDIDDEVEFKHKNSEQQETSSESNVDTAELS